MNAPEPTSQAQERAWVLRAQQGDADAFRHLVDAYDRRLLYFVLRFLPDADRALDVMQKVMIYLGRNEAGEPWRQGGFTSVGRGRAFLPPSPEPGRPP